MGEITLKGYVCERCGHKWAPRENIVARPRVCPKCKSAYWDSPRKLDSRVGNNGAFKAIWIKEKKMSLISIVDNNDRVIGSADYDRVHKNGLLHRMILVYIFDKDGQFLLQKRANEKPHGGLLGESLCAHVREGEDYVDTATRRMREELGILISNDDLREVTRAHVYTEENGWKNNTFTKIYECTSPTSPVIFNPSETQEILFYPIDKVLRLFRESPSSFVPGFKDTFREYLKIRHPDKLESLEQAR